MGSYARHTRYRPRGLVTAIQKAGGSAVTDFNIAQYNIEGIDTTYSTMHFTMADGHSINTTNTTEEG
jgi:hypothetical protein